MNAFWFSELYIPTTILEKEQLAEELTPGKLARDFWARCIIDAGLGVQEGFKEAFVCFFEAVNTQAKAHDAEIIPDLEYASDIDLPGCVVDDPIFQRKIDVAFKDLLGP